MPRSELIGYIRKSKEGQALKLSISKSAFDEAETYTTTDGQKYVSLIINADRTQAIMNGEREVTSICQLVD